MRNEITSATIRNRIAGDSKHRYRRHCKHSEKPFKQVSPNFSVIYFSLWLQRQIHMKHRCKYMVSSTRWSHLPFFSIALSLTSFLPLFPSARCFRKTWNEHTWHLLQRVIVWMITRSYRLNSLDNIYLADYHSLHLDAPPRTCSRLNVLRNFINVFLYLLHEAIFARRQTPVDTIVCRFTSVTWSTQYPVIHWTFCRLYRRSLFRISQTQSASDQFCCDTLTERY